jgi:hypothetical protein
VAHWWSWYHKLHVPIKKLKTNICLKGRAPPGSKRAQGCPLVAERCGALLKMPIRSTTLSINYISEKVDVVQFA